MSHPLFGHYFTLKGSQRLSLSAFFHRVFCTAQNLISSGPEPSTPHARRPSFEIQMPGAFISAVTFMVGVQSSKKVDARREAEVEQALEAHLQKFLHRDATNSRQASELLSWPRANS